jgi:hypothetical protein
MDRLLNLMKGEQSQLLLVQLQDLHQFGVDLIDEYISKVAKEKKGENLVSQTKAAEQLCATSSTLWRWSKKGLLHPVRFGGKVLYKQSELDKVKEA